MCVFAVTCTTYLPTYLPAALIIINHYLRAFDVEMLYIAQQEKIPIAEVAVNWQEIEGIFHLNPIIIIIFILLNVFLFCFL